MKITHLLLVPFTGLGLYNGFRGNRWLKNRIQVFEQFVIPSLLGQSQLNFIVWITWRPEEKSNILVLDFMKRLDLILGLRFVHTFHGCPFYDDKYPDSVARERLMDSLHGSMGTLLNVIGECEEVYLTIQPSDDLYSREAVALIQETFAASESLQAVGFSRGYIMHYATQELREYDPRTNPPFYTIRFDRETFIDPLKHANFTALKRPVDRYGAGTPLPSHEYVADCLQYRIIEDRGFLVGIHGENISTTFNHPYSSRKVEPAEKERVLRRFGIAEVPPLKIKYSFRKRLLRCLPQPFQKRIRYIFGEKLWNKVYEFLRR